MHKTKKPMTIIVLISISLKTDTNKYMTLDNDRAATFSPRKSYYIIPLNNT